MKSAEEHRADTLCELAKVLDQLKGGLKHLLSESDIHQLQIKNLTKAVSEYRKVALAHSVRIQALERLTCIDDNARKSS